MEPVEILNKTKSITFRKKTKSLFSNLFKTLDGYFFRTLFFVIILCCHLEGLEQYIPVILQFLGIDDVNLNGTLVAFAEFIGCMITIFFC